MKNIVLFPTLNRFQSGSILVYFVSENLFRKKILYILKVNQNTFHYTLRLFYYLENKVYFLYTVFFTSTSFIINCFSFFLQKKLKNCLSMLIEFN